MDEVVATLPYHTAEIGHLDIHCRKCGQLLETSDVLGGYLGSNGSYWCEGNEIAQTFHEPLRN